ncbi:MAG: hypothetical protein WDN28_24065 [Chthoniobacter sp.]
MNSSRPKSIKIVGTRRRQPASPAECVARALVLQRQMEAMNPYPKPRGFVFKARTRQDFEQWRRVQDNPRLW